MLLFVLQLLAIISVLAVFILFVFFKSRWGLIFCGVIGLCFSVYIDYTDELNYKFYCDKSIDKCSHLKNFKNDADFKEISSFKISDIKDVKSEQKFVKSRGRRKRLQEKLVWHIVFELKDGTVRYLPNNFRSNDFSKNMEMLSCNKSSNTVELSGLI